MDVCTIGASAVLPSPPDPLGQMPSAGRTNAMGLAPVDMHRLLLKAMRGRHSVVND